MVALLGVDLVYVCCDLWVCVAPGLLGVDCCVRLGFVVWVD